MTAGPVIPHGRTLSDATIDDYGEQVLAVIKMWGFNRADARRLCMNMKYRIENTPIKDWKDPLEGTGLKTDKVTEGGLVVDGEKRLFNFGDNENSG